MMLNCSIFFWPRRLAGAGDVYMRLRELLADEAQTRGLSEQDRQEMAKVVFMLLRSELDR